MMKRERIDKLLVERGLAPTRTRAQALVMAGSVLVDEQLVAKSSESFPPDAAIRVRGANDPAARYVGRGGVKLEKALGEFGVTGGFVCLDVGASTGGYRLLRSTARAASVGTSGTTDRVGVAPRDRSRCAKAVNARYMTAEDFDENSI